MEPVFLISLLHRALKVHGDGTHPLDQGHYGQALQDQLDPHRDHVRKLVGHWKLKRCIQAMISHQGPYGTNL